jgi:hypothetical protein
MSQTVVREAPGIVDQRQLELVRAAAEGEPVSAPLREFLAWVARCARSYDEAMEAWRSSCPRFTVWEDALAAGFVHVDEAHGRAGSQVRLTSRGRAALSQS